MAITPAAGWQVDPNNPNGVIPTAPAPAGNAPAPITSGPVTTPSGAIVDAGSGGLYGQQPGSSPAAAPIKRTIDTSAGADAAETYLNTFQAPQTAEQIAEGKRKAAQSLIDSINKRADDELAQEKLRGTERTNQNNSISVLSGLMGSTEAVRTDRTVTDANAKAEQAVNNKRALDLAAVYTKISSDAATEAEQQKLDATKSAESIVARRKEVQTQALESIKTMAAGGLVDFENFKNSPQNAAVYQHAVDAAGSEDALRAIFTINRPQDQIVGTPMRVGDHYVQAYKNPITGKVSFDTINIPGGLGTEYTSFQKLGDNLVAIPDGWDGDTSKLKTIAGVPSQADLLDQEYKRAQIANMNDPLDRQYKQAQIDKLKSETSGGGDPGGQLYAGLKPATATAIRSQVGAFKTEPVVQNFAVIQEGRNFAGSLDNKTTNPADDQALIYSLAKALDPGSVVREGEYATAQKYAQSWIQAYGKNVTQALAGTGFLSETARRNIKDTIEAKYKASLSSYKNLQGQYEQGINNLTGRDDGSKFIRDYQTPTGGGSTVTAPDGTQVEIID